LGTTVVFVSFLIYIFPIFVKFVPTSAKTNLDEQGSSQETSPR
jgi:hypothetical protein